jgi:hypothetical protein
MEPRHYRQLAIALLVVGAILSGLGLLFIYYFHMNTEGAVMLIFGCAMALLSLPTFMVLMLFTSFIENKK